MESGSYSVKELQLLTIVMAKSSRMRQSTVDQLKPVN